MLNLVVLRKLMIITIAFFISWLPVAVMVALDFITQNPSFNIWLAHLATTGGVLNSTINPILVIGLDKRYQAVFKEIMEKCSARFKKLFI